MPLFEHGFLKTAGIWLQRFKVPRFQVFLFLGWGGGAEGSSCSPTSRSAKITKEKIRKKPHTLGQSKKGNSVTVKLISPFYFLIFGDILRWCNGGCCDWGLWGRYRWFMINQCCQYKISFVGWVTIHAENYGPKVNSGAAVRRGLASLLLTKHLHKRSTQCVHV